MEEMELSIERNLHTSGGGGRIANGTPKEAEDFRDEYNRLMLKHGPSQESFVLLIGKSRYFLNVCKSFTLLIMNF